MEILHVIGLCPDSIAHTDLIDFVIANYTQIQDIIKNIMDIKQKIKIYDFEETHKKFKKSQILFDLQNEPQKFIAK
jgi:hypothetical protein